jgi:hypothetical protein
MSGISEKDIAKALQRPGALPALLTALGVLVFLVTQNVAFRLIGAARAAMYGGAGGVDVGAAWATEMVSILGGPLFFAIGVFLCLWQVAPIAPNLRLAHVVTRALLATALGAAGYWLFRFISTLIFLAVDGSLGVHPDLIGGIAFDASMDALQALVTWLALVVLGAVFLWGWLQRHPSKEPVTGTLDEV